MGFTLRIIHAPHAATKWTANFAENTFNYSPLADSGWLTMDKIWDYPSDPRGCTTLTVWVIDFNNNTLLKAVNLGPVNDGQDYEFNCETWKLEGVIVEPPPVVQLPFMNWIRERLVEVFQLFYLLYDETAGWVWPFNLVSILFYSLFRTFVNMAGDWIDFSAWVSDVWTKISNIWTSEGILGLIKWWFPWLFGVGEWFYDRWNWFTSAVGDWWDATKVTVLGWIDIVKEWFLELIANIEKDLAKLWSDLQWFFDNLMTFDEIIAWWKNWLGRVAAALVQWGFAKLVDVAALIATAFLEREDFWAGWQDMRDNVMDFFTDPLEFLWNMFTDWFLEPEE